MKIGRRLAALFGLAAPFAAQLNSAGFQGALRGPQRERRGRADARRWLGDECYESGVQERLVLAHGKRALRSARRLREGLPLVGGGQ